MSRVRIVDVHGHDHPTKDSKIVSWHAAGSRWKARELHADGYANVLVLRAGENCPACAIEAERLKTWDRVLP